MLIVCVFLLYLLIALVFAVSIYREKVNENEELKDKNKKYKELIKKHNLEAEIENLQPP